MLTSVDWPANIVREGAEVRVVPAYFPDCTAKATDLPAAITKARELLHQPLHDFVLQRGLPLSIGDPLDGSDLEQGRVVRIKIEVAL